MCLPWGLCVPLLTMWHIRLDKVSLYNFHYTNKKQTASCQMNTLNGAKLVVPVLNSNSWFLPYFTLSTIFFTVADSFWSASFMGPLLAFYTSNLHCGVWMTMLWPLAICSVDMCQIAQAELLYGVTYKVWRGRRLSQHQEAEQESIVLY